jgi:hypothetical protein
MLLFGSIKLLLSRAATKKQIGFALFEWFAFAVVATMIGGYFQGLTANEAIVIGFGSGLAVAIEMVCFRFYMVHVRKG